MRKKYYKIDIEEKIIKLILLFAVFNDLLRIPSTRISAYRLCLFIILLLMVKHIYYLKKIVIICCVLFFLNIMQNYLFVAYGYENKLDYNSIIYYTFHYISIIAIFVLMRIIRKSKKELFEQLYPNWFVNIGVILLIVYPVTVIMPHNTIIATNINDYALMLSALSSVYLSLAIKEKKYLLPVIAILIEQLVFDNKAAAAGTFVAILIYLIILNKSYFFQKKIATLIFLLLAIIGALVLVLSPITIHGYPIREMFIEFIGRISRGEYFETKGYSSLYFRVNSTIMMFTSIISNPIMGYGIGNTSKILYYSFPYYRESMGVTAIGLSPHNAYLEFICDCGIWALILCITSIFIAFKTLLKNELSNIEIFRVIFILSAPIWIISSSGIYTIYLFFIVVSYLYEEHIKSKKCINFIPSIYKKRKKL